MNRLDLSLLSAAVVAGAMALPALAAQNETPAKPEAAATNTTPAVEAARRETQIKPGETGLDIVGFNHRGLYYGIEQFGRRRDGTPYAEIRIYDLRHDAEIERSPFVYEVKEKIPAGVTMAQAVDRARRGVYRDARRVIRFLTLVPRGNIVFAERNTLPRALQISAPEFSGMLMLETFPLKSERCKGEPTVGYRLRVTGVLGDQVIHEDKALPKDRGCPVDYGIRAANVFQPYPDSIVLAVIVGAKQGRKAKEDLRHTVAGHVYMRDEKGWH